MIFPDSSIVEGVVRASSFGRAALPLYGADRRVFAINLNHHPPPLPSRRHFQSILNYFMSPASMRLLLDDFVSPSALVRILLLLLSPCCWISVRLQTATSRIDNKRNQKYNNTKGGRVVIKTFFSAGNTGNIFHFQSNDNEAENREMEEKKSPQCKHYGNLCPHPHSPPTIIIQCPP